MERKKLTPEEIQALRVEAEKERAVHAEVMKNLRAVTMSSQLQMSTLMSSYQRGRKDEILALLQTHATGNRQYELSSEVMLFIYEHGAELPKAKEYMLQNNHLVYEVEKRIFDDKLPPFVTTKKGELLYPKFCLNAEVYIVEQTLKACQKADKLSDELKFLTDYTAQHSLSTAAEFTLTNFLFVNTGRDSVIDALRSFVLGYLVHYQHIAEDAQVRIIESGNHQVIMYYITHSSRLISAPKVLDALMERADAEEVTAYFNRWAKESC